MCARSAAFSATRRATPGRVILPAPVDWTTDIVEAMFKYGTSRVQFGAGVLRLVLLQRRKHPHVPECLRLPATAGRAGVEYPDAYGRAALEPDNSYLQFKAYGGMNFTPSTRLTADFSYGKMEQDEALLPYTVNPDLVVHTPVPLASLDAEVNTTMLNLRLTSQLARRLGLARQLPLRRPRQQDATRSLSLHRRRFAGPAPL